MVWTTALVFLVLELVIRLYIIILIIHWWVCIGLIGVGLIIFASFLIYKNNSKKTKD